ncbi:MAG TPA: DUF4870 domain-containing protein [Leeuwenhoekiella sp.]|nr:DUF4870 domain-containing protein [Leeuwenhoekiella sp.]
MPSSINSHHRSVTTFIHLATFTKYLIPLGNFIFPLLLWTAQRKESPFVDEHGRRAINFQISMFIYSICAILVALPFIAWQVIGIVKANEGYDFEGDFDAFWNFFQISGLVITAIVLGTVLTGFFIVELIAVISAAIRANSGEMCHYPLSIPFIKSQKNVENNNASASSTEENQ